MPYNEEEVGLLVKLIRQSATLELTSAFLKSQGLHYSAGTWESMINDRLLPAVSDGTLPPSALIDLLRDSEEYGNQHVFLYRCRGGEQRARLLMKRPRIEEEVKKRGLVSILSQSAVVDMPPSPKIVDMRWEGSGDDECFVIKIVETRQEKTYLGDDTTEDNRYIRQWRIEKARAVNVFCLHSNGLVEQRIFSHKNSTKYNDDSGRMWNIAGRILPRGDVDPWNILTAKEELWRRKKRLGKQVRYYTTSFRNDNGTLLRASSVGEQSNLFTDPAATGSVDSFAKSGAYCESLVVHWIGRGDGNKTGPSRTVLLRLAGESNEYAVAAQCSREDHGFVLDNILKLNR